MREVFAFPQRSPEWYAARAGLVTASEFKTVLRERGRTKGSESATRKAYLYKLAGEIVTGQPAESYDNPYMERGRVQEPEARDLYAFAHDVEPQLVGFIRNGRAGCSPDSLIGDDGMLEIKTATAGILIDHLMSGAFPAEHVAQCQGNLWLAERDWIDLAIYSPGLPLFVKRAARDATYIADLSRAVDQFYEELDAIVDRVRRYGQPPAVIVKAALVASNILNVG